MNSNIIPVLFQSLLVQLPMILVALVACIVTIMSWQQSPSASMFSLLGFGLTLLLCFAIPITQSVVQGWMAANTEHATNIRFVMTGIGIFWSILRAVSYGLLLAAVYTGRAEPRSMPITYPPVPPTPPR